MRTWWNNLSERDQKILRLGSIVSIVLLLYILVWHPYNQYTYQLRKSVNSNRQLLTWLNMASLKLNKSHHKPPSLVITPDNFKTTLEQTGIEQLNLDKFTHIEQKANGLVQIDINEVSFDDLLSWLDNLWQQYRIAVTTANIEQHSSPGMVNANLELKL